MRRLERFLFHPIHYYIPLVPRLGTTYRLTPADKELIKGQPLSSAAQKLRIRDGQDIIPSDHIDHFVYGAAVRATINVSISIAICGSGVPLFIPTALCIMLNDSHINYTQIEKLRQQLNKS
jgi:hypothetical protein